MECGSAGPGESWRVRARLQGHDRLVDRDLSLGALREALPLLRGQGGWALAQGLRVFCNAATLTGSFRCPSEPMGIAATLKGPWAREWEPPCGKEACSLP